MVSPRVVQSIVLQQTSCVVEGDLFHLAAFLCDRLAADRLLAAGWDAWPSREEVPALVLRTASRNHDALTFLIHQPQPTGNVLILELKPQQCYQAWYDRLQRFFLYELSLPPGAWRPTRQRAVALQWLAAWPQATGQAHEGPPRGAIMLLDSAALATRVALWEWRYGEPWGRGRKRGVRARDVVVHEELAELWASVLARAGFRVRSRRQHRAHANVQILGPFIHLADQGGAVRRSPSWPGAGPP